MKVYIRGVEFFGIEAIPPSELFDELSDQPIYEDEFREHRITLLVESTQDYWCGVMVTNKGRKGVPVITNANGNYVLHVRETPKGESVIDFNFFVIKKTCQSGVITSYSGSGGPTNFGDFLNVSYQKMIAARKEEKLAELQDEPDSKKKKKREKEIRKKYKPRKFKAKAIVSKETFTQMLNKMKEFHSVEVIKPSDGNSWYSDISNVVSRDTKKIHVERNSNPGPIRRFIGKFIGNHAQVNDVTVSGKTDGKTITFGFKPRIEGLEELDYNDVLTEKNLTFTKVSATPIMRQLKEVLLDNAQRFP